MFAKLSALLLALPLVSALTIDSLTNPTAGDTVTITWTASTDDPAYFSIELQNPAFNKQYAIANNVQTSLGQITITLPQVLPGSDYQLVAIQISNVNDVLSTSGAFSIGSESSSSASAASTASSVSASSGTLSTPSATTTGPLSSASSISSVSAASTPGSTGASTGASTAASSTPSSFGSSGAAPLKLPGMLPAAAALLAAAAGAAMVF